MRFSAAEEFAFRNRTLERHPKATKRNDPPKRLRLWRIALRVRTAIFEIALVAVIGEAVGYTDRGAAVRDAISEVADRSGLVLAGQAHVVVRAIDRDMIFAVVPERFHQLLEIFLAAHFAHVGGGEVGVHAGAVPVGVAERLAMEFDID